MKKKIFTELLALILTLIICVGIIACNSNSTDDNRLSAPTNLRIEEDILKWNFVENALGYTVKIVEMENADINTVEGEEIAVSSTQYSLSSLKNGKYTVGVKARGDGTNYTSSYFVSVIYTKSGTNAGLDEDITGPFESFESINSGTSYLGYGIDVIEAPFIRNKNIKIQAPIFSRDKLLLETLLMDNDNSSILLYASGETIEEFRNSLAISGSMGVSQEIGFNGNIDGLDVGLGNAFSIGLKSAFQQTTDKIKSQYFLELLAENRNYWLVLQTPQKKYKELLSDDFKEDLYDSSVTPENLFKTYGTHLITSLAMGGSVNIYYSMSSESETTTKDLYIELSKKIKDSASVGIGEYGVSGSTEKVTSLRADCSDFADQNNIEISRYIATVGGGVPSISTENDFFDKYADWQKTLKDNPTVVGIKDSNSLYPIWELIDRSTEEGEARYQELYSYFVLYGSESYSSLCEYYGIKPNTSGAVKISSPEDLEMIRENPNGNFILTDNIDLTESLFSPIESFNGTLDGNGKKIINWKMPDVSHKPKDIMNFGFIEKNSGTIQNLFMEYNEKFVGYSINYRSGSKVDIKPINTWYFSVGSLVAVNQAGGKVINCGVDGANIYVSQSFADLGGTINEFVGGLIGYNQEGSFAKNIYATNCTIYGWNSADGQDKNSRVQTTIGGLIGFNGRNSQIYNAYAYGNNISAKAMGGYWLEKTPQYVYSYASALAGYNMGTIARAIVYDNTVNSSTQKYSGAPNTLTYKSDFACVNRGIIKDCADLGSSYADVKSPQSGSTFIKFEISSLDELSKHSVLGEFFTYDNSTNNIIFATIDE